MKELLSKFDPARPLAFAIFLFFFIFAAFPDIILGCGTFFYRDFGLFGYPLAEYHRQSFWRGEMPLWNPFSNCGLPFLAQWNTMVLYPPALFYLVMPLSWALGVFCLAHLFLAGLGMYFLAGRWTGNPLGAAVAGLAYAFNGLMLHSLMWPNNIAALAWLPWVIFFVEGAWRGSRRWFFIAALVATLQLLSGAPEVILLTWLLLLTLVGIHVWRASLNRRTVLIRFFGIGGLVAGLAAVQLLPFLDLLAHSQRDRTFGNDCWAMPAWGWANFVLPLFRCTPSRLGVFSQDEQQWTSSYYVGIGILALALIALHQQKSWRVRWLGIVAACGALLAMGRAGYLYQLFERGIPWIGFVRFPIKFVVLVVFSLPLLAAFTIARLQRTAKTDLKKTRLAFAGCGGLIILFLASILWVAHHFPFPGDSWDSTAQSGASRGIFLILVLGILYGWFRSSRPSLQWALLLVVGLDGLTHAPRQNPSIPLKAYARTAVDTNVMPQLGSSRAMLSGSRRAFLDSASATDPLTTYLGQRQSLYGNCNLLEPIPKVDGFYSLYLREESQIQTLLEKASESLAGLADFLGIAQVSSPNELFGWTNRSSFLPLITAGQRPFFTDSPSVLRGLASPNFRPDAVVYLPLEARSAVGVSNAASAKILSSRVTPHRVEIEISAQDQTMVTVAQSFYHNWKAFVDKRPTALWRANHAFQALQIPAGRHHIEIVYVDRCFRIGLVISILCALFTIGGLIRCTARPPGGPLDPTVAV